MRKGRATDTRDTQLSTSRGDALSTVIGDPASVIAAPVMNDRRTRSPKTMAAPGDGEQHRQLPR